jgi:hypothetical protein
VEAPPFVDEGRRDVASVLPVVAPETLGDYVGRVRHLETVLDNVLPPDQGVEKLSVFG